LSKHDDPPTQAQQEFSFLATFIFLGYLLRSGVSTNERPNPTRGAMVSTTSTGEVLDLRSNRLGDGFTMNLPSVEGDYACIYSVDGRNS
jgi:hypothetical protein